MEGNTPSDTISKRLNSRWRQIALRILSKAHPHAAFSAALGVAYAIRELRLLAVLARTNRWNRDEMFHFYSGIELPRNIQGFIAVITDSFDI